MLEHCSISNVRQSTNKAIALQNSVLCQSVVIAIIMKCILLMLYQEVAVLFHKNQCHDQLAFSNGQI